MTHAAEGIAANQLALVTGAGRGIGRAVARALAREGARLLLVARSETELEETGELCRQGGSPEVGVLVCDLSHPGAVEELAQRVLTLHGGVDILVNNAGMLAAGNPVEGDPAEWERMLALNLLAPMILTRRLAPAMVQAERGTIVNIGSVAAIEPMSRSGAYAASKHGLRGWSRSCYAALRPWGIKVVLVNPGFVRTRLVDSVPGVLPERFLLPEDVAEAVLLAIRTSPNCCPEEIVLRLTRPAWADAARS